ncbi:MULTISPECIES: FAD-dependent oxidoreductase [Bradyrhizobium]|jgi:2,4-dienoyl-CoA reductase-like NADH-dependent reductase (Old Yellow Enzyme family)/thioredoxin reductase|uniref:2,4-dienoyl-CoA reductase n=2 Tax=Bradyrhizobium TaxID=374 RepID=A0ABY0PDG3_9BRAD|nr:MULTISPECIES: FAD-dependent oxidoreductase [Bradyrhizobium]SDI15642.1 2,4-dienoyl-CoA reductase [Bradyrhizobium ottawaense]SED78193.1 2,4-dienoyl-CoA reductase [Bradyrhizobium lablabi]SHL73746.1 2,4-dienoyl-CoA reductase [Bradyrhizobium lablabi]
MFPKLFAPGKIGSLELPNRVVFAATSSELADKDGFVGDDLVEYYAERARGGTGLIVVEATYIEQEGKRLHHNAMLNDDCFIPGLRKVVQAAHAEGAKMALQLNHGGRESIPDVSGSVPLAPSPIPSQFTGVGDAVIPKELTVGEIDRIVERFAEAARRSRDAGFDAVELHGAHGYLIGEFLSPDSNKREDDYGGSVQGRAYFCVRLIRAIKARLGADYPVIVRMNGRDHVQHGLELDDAIEMAVMFEAAGADSISVSGGVHASRPYMVVPGMSVDRGCYVSYGDAIRKRVKVPVMVVGRINTPELAEQILEDGQADFICLSRALIADPHFPAKAKAGRVETIAPCIACNECIATVHRHKGLACTVNPMVSRELELKPLLALKPDSRRVVVIGSGAAGLSAAVTAARRGHDVHLYEKEGVIGGQLLLAHQPPHRGEIKNALRYFTSEIARLGIPVSLNRSFSADDARALRPEAIIVATGASPVQPDVPGSDLPHVLSGWRVIAGLETAGQTCVVVGGGLVGIEVADYLADQGKKVIMIVRSEMLKKAVHADRVYYLDRVAELNIEVLANMELLAVGPDWVEIRPEGRVRRTLHDIDSVIFCTGYASRKAETDSLEGLGIAVHYAGDVGGPRKFFQAIEEGTLTALRIV